MWALTPPCAVARWVALHSCPRTAAAAAAGGGAAGSACLLWPRALCACSSASPWGETPSSSQQGPCAPPALRSSTAASAGASAACGRTAGLTMRAAARSGRASGDLGTTLRAAPQRRTCCSHTRAAAAPASAHATVWGSSPPAEQQEDSHRVLQRDHGPTPTSAYVHLPFCKRRCYYCDFPVQVVGARAAAAPGVAAGMQEYVDLLCEEVRAQAVMGGAPLATVFFGGGTPSLLPPPLLGQILDLLRARFGIAPDAEVSLEADPGTFDAARLRAYQALGVTRFSVGVQAFQQELLEACGRSHGAADVAAALADIAAAAPASWSLDLMAGLPHLSAGQWRASLEAAVAARPPHISVYDLQVEERTPFGRWYSPGSAPLPADEEAAQMYRTASALLAAAGYEHYEISNYALPGHRCAHNMVYWGGAPYYAFGLGAASYLAGRRHARPRKMAAYRQWVRDFVARGGGLPHDPGQAPENEQDRLLDAAMLRLRLADGLDLGSVAAQFGSRAARQVHTALEPHMARGLVAEVGAPRRPQPGASQGPACSMANAVAPGAGFRAEAGKASVVAAGVAASALSSGRAAVSMPTPALPCETEFSSGGGVEREACWPVLRLSDPDGFLVSNDIISDVFAAVMP